MMGDDSAPGTLLSLFGKSRIASRLIVYVVLFSSLITLATTALQVFLDYRHDRDTIESYMRQIESSYLSSLVNSVWVSDETQIRSQIEGLARLPDMEYLGIRVDGAPKWVTGERRSKYVIAAEFPLVQSYKGRDITIGVLETVASLDAVYDRLIGKVAIILAGNAFKTFLVAGFMLFLFQVLVTKHLNRMAAHVRDLDLKQPVKPLTLEREPSSPADRDELDQVANALNETWATLEDSYDEIRESEERFRAIFEQAADSILLIDETGQILEFNDVAAANLGYSRQAFAKLRIPDVDPSHSPEAIAERIERVSQRGMDFFETKLKSKNGELRDVLVGAKGISVHGRNLFLVTLRDITERTLMERRLRDNEQFLRQITDALPGIVYYKDMNRRYRFANQRYVEWFGIDPATMPGKTTIEVIGEEFYAQIREYEYRALSGETAFFEGTWARPDGETRWYRASYMPHMDADGTVLGMIGLSVDITDQKRHDADLAAAHEEAEKSSRAKTEFLSNMSHELRTPLNSVIGFSDILAGQMFGPLGSDDYVGYAKDINDSARHLLQLINDILDVSRIERGKLSLDEHRIDVRHLLMSCSRLASKRADRDHAEIVVEAPSSLPALLADERRVKQILINLLSNATKFTPDEGRVTVSASLDAANRFILAVSDDGIGIDEDDIETVMSPFGQVDGSLARNYEGAGLGLPLSRQLAEMHGADLSLESSLGEGTVVTVSFPPERTVFLE
jgi:PAS domain S-box-containing protein